jgi:hypothetical protein
MAFLPPEASHLADRHAADPHFGQGFFDVFQFERLDNAFDLFHAYVSFDASGEEVRGDGLPERPATVF